jgi:bifunctional DNase/RNase
MPVAGDPQNLSAVEVERIIPFRDSAAVVLRHPEKHFMIFVGPAEAAAIRRELRGDRTERPLTHELISYVFQGFDIRVTKVVISSIVNDVFCATLVLEQDRTDEPGGKNEVRLDVRASDSMVIALKSKAQIWVTRRVLDKVEDVSETLARIDEQLAAAKSAEEEAEAGFAGGEGLSGPFGGDDDDDEDEDEDEPSPGS